MSEIEKAIEFYSKSPDGQYDYKVVVWLEENIRMRAELARLREQEPVATTLPDGYGGAQVIWTDDPVVCGSLYAAPVAAVPYGWVLVPKEPTEAMLSAASDNWSGWQESSMRDYTPSDSDIRILWNAMLAAAQEGK